MTDITTPFPATPHKLGLYPVVDSVAWIARLLEAGVTTIQLRIKWNGSVEVYRVVARGVRLKGRLLPSGRVSWGQIDKLLPPPSGRPFRLPDLTVDLADTNFDPAAQTVTLGEAAIDLVKAGIFDPDECEEFGTVYGVSRSSGSSGSAAMKDLVGPAPFRLANCGEITVEKETIPAGAEGEFDFTLENSVTENFTLEDGDSETFDELQAGDYTITEDDPGPLFALVDIECTGTHEDNINIDLANRSVTISLEADDSVTCKFTNELQTGALLIHKDSTKGGSVTNAGAEFTITRPDDAAFELVAVDNGANDEDPATGVVCVEGLLVGDYEVNESSAPTGYGGASESDVPFTVVAGTDCGDDTPDSSLAAVFVNAPLADIQVRFRDGGSNETFLDQPLTCDAGSGTASTADTANWDDTLTITGIEIDNPVVTITCTIEIDP